MKYWSYFFELAKVRLIIAVSFTGFTGMVMAHRAIPSFNQFTTLTLLLIATGFAIAIQNNLFDMHIDGQMSRTDERIKAIVHIGEKKLWIYSTSVLIVVLITSYYLFNITISLLILLTIITYVFWYTLILKRNNPFGAVLGGIPGALPVLIGGYGISSRFAIDIWLYFLLMILWQPPHFWALSLRIQSDYEKAKIPVLPVIYGTRYTSLMIYIYCFSLIPVTLSIYLLAGYGLFFLILSSLLGVYYALISLVALEKTKDYDKSFKASLVYIMGIGVAILGDILIK